MSTPCVRPGCGGTVLATGFCDRCGRRPSHVPAPTQVERGTGPSSGSGPRGTDSGAWVSGDLLSLPVFELPDPSSLVLANPEVPETSRYCAECGHPVARTFAGQAPLLDGHCGRCGELYSFSLKLVAGDLLADRYEVVGALQRGGLGWVYLARARHLDDTYVVLKGLINSRDRRARELVANERTALTRLNHPNIVRIYDFVQHPDPTSGEPVDYLVMEHVGGPSLAQLKNDPAVRARHGQVRVEHVIAYGLEILAALDHLHGNGLLYCDMKPGNVIRGTNRLKVIDLGAVRALDDHESLVVGTRGYQVAEEELRAHGLTIRSDLHTVGRTLETLFQVTEDAGAPEARRPRTPASTRFPERTASDDATRAAPSEEPLTVADSDAPEDVADITYGVASFRRVLARATGPFQQRFTTATEMGEQLRGVLREILAMRGTPVRPSPSRLFEDSVVLLDTGLGAIPPLGRWAVARSLAELAEELPGGRPSPGRAAAALPAPLVRADDPEAGYLAALVATDARELLGTLDGSGRESAEIHLRACRALVQLGEADAAESRLAAAVDSGGLDDWRPVYFRGLLALVREDVPAARRAFTEVRDAFPGELAPKLALGFCAEHAGDAAEARAAYQAGWPQDRTHASAAFGLARLALAGGDRDAAVAVLDDVPPECRHAQEARIAALRVRAGRLPGDELPSARDLTDAVHRLAALSLDGGEPDGANRARLAASLREVALARMRREPVRLPGSAVLGEAPTVRSLRALLETSIRGLARQSGRADAHAALVDLANDVRPRTWW